jgi:hypothetical protein
MSNSAEQVRVGPNDIAFVTLGLWGFLTWPLPWPGILVGTAAPALAILIWALFRSPRAVFRLDPFGKAVVEIAVFGAASFAWWDLGQPVVAITFALLATASGVLSGRREIAQASRH